MKRDEAYWRHIRELAAAAPEPPADALDLLRRNGFPQKLKVQDERRAS